MRTMKLIDVTLREGAAIRGRELTFKEKLEIARSLDRLKADTIELAPIGGSKAEELSQPDLRLCQHRRRRYREDLGQHPGCEKAQAEPAGPCLSGTNGIYLS